MAIATLNPLLISISGKIGGLVFYKRKKTQCVRSYVVPRNPDTVSQRYIRALFAEAVRSWQALSSENKYKFTRRARGLNMSGYNLYISEYMKETNAAESTPAIKLSFMDLFISSCGRRHIHSVSASSSRAFGILTSPGEHSHVRGPTFSLFFPPSRTV